MSRLKAYAARTDEDCMFLAEAETRNQARARLCGEVGEEYVDTRVERVPWLDGFADLDGPDAQMAEARHGWSFDTLEFEGTELEPEDGFETYDGRFTPMETFGEDESRWELFARLIGARYPDRYKPREEES